MPAGCRGTARAFPPARRPAARSAGRRPGPRPVPPVWDIGCHDFPGERRGSLPRIRTISEVPQDLRPNDRDVASRGSAEAGPEPLSPARPLSPAEARAAGPLSASAFADRIRVVPVADPDSPDARLARRALEAADRADGAELLRLVRTSVSRIDLVDPAVWPAVFSTIPAAALQNEPELAFVSAVVQSFERGSTHVSPEQRSAFRALEGDGAGRSPRSRLLSFFVEIEGERIRGRFDDALAAAEAFREHVLARASEPAVEDLTPAAFIMLGTTALLMGRYDDALRAFHDCERTARWAQHPIERFAGAYLALTHLLADSPDLADEHLDRAPAERTSPPGSWTFVYESATLFVPALRALADADRRGALAALERIDEHTELSPFGWLGAHVRARAALLWGDPETALAETKQTAVNAGALAGPGTLTRSVLHADIADLALAAGRLGEAVDAAFDRHATAPFALLEASRARLNPEFARDGVGGLDDTAGRRARASVALIDLSEAGPARNSAFKQAAQVVRETRSAAASVETSAASRTTLWTLLGRPASDLPTTGFARNALRRLDLLSPRELEVFFALDTSAPMKQLSVQLSISENTLKTHLKSIYRKLGVSSRREIAELVRRAASGRRTGGEGTA